MAVDEGLVAKIGLNYLGPCNPGPVRDDIGPGINVLSGFVSSFAWDRSGAAAGFVVSGPVVSGSVVSGSVVFGVLLFCLLCSFAVGSIAV